MVSFFVLSALHISCHPSLSTGRINTFSNTSFNLPPPQTPKAQLMSSSVVLRMADFNIYQVINNTFQQLNSNHVHRFALNAFIFISCVCVLQVSTADQRRTSPKTMISCNKKSLYLPPEMPAIHVEFTEYYFPDGKDYPSEMFNT